MKRLTETET